MTGKGNRALFREELLVDLDGTGTENDHEQRRKHEEDHREQQLHRDPLRELLGALAALLAELLGLRPQHVRDAYAEQIGLDHRQREALELGNVRALAEVPEGLRSA